MYQSEELARALATDAPKSTGTVIVPIILKTLALLIVPAGVSLLTISLTQCGQINLESLEDRQAIRAKRRDRAWEVHDSFVSSVLALKNISLNLDPEIDYEHFKACVEAMDQQAGQLKKESIKYQAPLRLLDPRSKDILDEYEEFYKLVDRWFWILESASMRYNPPIYTRSDEASLEAEAEMNLAAEKLIAHADAHLRELEQPPQVTTPPKVPTMNRDAVDTEGTPKQIATKVFRQDARRPRAKQSAKDASNPGHRRGRVRTHRGSVGSGAKPRR